MTPRLAAAVVSAAIPLAAAQPTVRVNHGPGGVQGNNWNEALAVNADGRHVFFVSRSTNLVPGGTSGRQLFAADRDPDANGVYDEGNTTVTLMSRGIDGSPGNGTQGGYNGFYGIDCSADGRFVVWQSQSTNLVPDDLTGWPHYDVFVRDRDPDGNGTYDEGNGVNERVSLGIGGAEADRTSNGTDYQISISDDGRYVAYASFSNNLIDPPPDDARCHAYLHDRQTGQRTLLDAATTTVNGGAFSPRVSPDGSTIVYLANNDPFHGSDWDQLHAVAPDGRSPALISKDDFGNEANGDSERFTFSHGHRTSADGRFVVFITEATNLDVTRPNDQDGFIKLMLHDRDADGNGVFDEPGGWTTRRLDVDPAGTGGAGSPQCPDISADGSRVVFVSFAGHLVPGDATPSDTVGDAFLYGRDAGTLEIVSRATDGTQGNLTTWKTVISRDGGTLVFDSEANNLVAGDTNHRNDAFARTLPPAPCNAVDLAPPHGVLDLADINAFVAAFLANDPAADLDQNGVHDLTDLNTFVQTFLAGCP